MKPDDGHATANRADAEQLHQSDHAGNPHGVLQQRQLHVGELGAGQAACARHDEQRRQVAHEHGQDVLQAQRHRLGQGHIAFEREDAKRLHRAGRAPLGCSSGLALGLRRALGGGRRPTFASRRCRVALFLFHFHLSRKNQENVEKVPPTGPARCDNRPIYTQVTNTRQRRRAAMLSCAGTRFSRAAREFLRAALRRCCRRRRSASFPCPPCRRTGAP